MQPNLANQNILKSAVRMWLNKSWESEVIYWKSKAGSFIQLERIGVCPRLTSEPLIRFSWNLVWGIPILFNIDTICRYLYIYTSRPGHALLWLRFLLYYIVVNYAREVVGEHLSWGPPCFFTQMPFVKKHRDLHD